MVALNGEQITLEGKLVEVGQKAPDFELVSAKLDRVSLNAYEGKYKILNIFSSVDTGVCALSVKRFQERLQLFGSSAFVLLHISKDLPFAQSRFCANDGTQGAMCLSAFDSSFGQDYGLLIGSSPLKGLLTRAVLLLDPQNEVQYIEVVTDLANEPNYGQAFENLENFLKEDPQ